MSKKTVIIIILAAAVTVGLGIGIFVTVKVFNNQKTKITGLEDEIDTLLWQVEAYGQAVDCYKIKPGIEIKHGAEFRPEDIEVMVLPESMITDRYVTDPEMLAGHIYRVDVSAETPLVWDLFTTEEVGQTERFYDVVADVFPVEPDVGQYYDLRIVMPKGQDYVVLSKKRVVNYYNSAIRVKLDEEEIHQYQSALVDTFVNPGTYLYVTTYVEPNMQKQATSYYPVGNYVMQIMELDPNIVKLAEQDMTLRRRVIFEAGLNETEVTPEEIAGQIVAGRSEQVSRLNTAAQNVLQKREQEAATARAAEEGAEQPVTEEGAETADESSNLMSNTYNNPMADPYEAPPVNDGTGNGATFIEGGN